MDVEEGRGRGRGRGRGKGRGKGKAVDVDLNPKFSGPRCKRVGAVLGSQRRTRFQTNQVQHRENVGEGLEGSREDSHVVDDLFLDGDGDGDGDGGSGSGNDNRLSPLSPWVPDEEDEEFDGCTERVRRTSSSAGLGVVSLRRGDGGRFVTNDSECEVEGGHKYKKKKATRDNSWLLCKPAPGGPNKVDVIPSFGGHVASRIWEGKDRGVLSSHTRERVLHQMGEWQMLDDSVIQTLRDSKLLHLRECMFPHLDLPLVSAFVERWQPDTNTFHLPFGEMSILLHDVHYILRLPVQGLVCSGSATHDQIFADMCELLALSPNELVTPLDGKKSKTIYKGGGVLSYSVMDRCSRESSSRQSQIQGYLLLLLGSTLFVDKSGDHLRASTNLLLKNLDVVSKYAWGAGALAYLYRELGVASRAEAKGIAGCLTLLEAWIYEYFPLFRPTRTCRQISSEEPRSNMWDPRGRAGKSDKVTLMHYRNLLDNLTPDQVNWLPYGKEPQQVVPITLFSGCIRFLTTIEPYTPERCVRQFGYVQVVPPHIPPSKAYRPAVCRLYDVEFPNPEWLDYLWQNCSNHMVPLKRDYTLAVTLGETIKKYMDWFLDVSHPRLIPPENAVTQPPIISSDLLANDIIGKLAPLLDQPRDQRAPGTEEIYEKFEQIQPLIQQWRSSAGTSSGRIAPP